MKHFVPVFVVAAALLAMPTRAQQADASGRTVYPAAFFQQFQPATALQIVERVPGFLLIDPVDDNDGDVRGFSQAAGNVVINGQRPSSKSDTLATVLARIPANRVLRVEVGSGTAFGSDYASRAQVVNLVLTAAGGVAGTITGTVYREYTGALLPEGSIAALVRRGNSTFNVSAGVNNNRTREEGTDTFVTLPGREPIELRRKVNEIRDPNGFVSAGWEHNAGDFRTAHLNGRWALDRFQLLQTNDVRLANGTVRDDRLSQYFNRRDLEIGGDVTRPLAGGGIKLVGLATRRHRRNFDDSFLRVRSSIVGGGIQRLEDEREETLARLVWNRANLAGWSVEVGAEGVLNKLDSRVDLFGLGAGGVRTRIDLPVDQAVVEETRAEGFANVGRALTPKLRLDVGMRYETSRLQVSGDATADRRLNFLKPSVALDWRPEDGWRVQASVKRTVAQLNFEDFISAAELTNERVNGGNANLLPQRAWESLVTVERRVLTDGLIKVELGYDRVSLVQDRVPTPEGFDAPGNLGSGSRRIARLQGDLPLGPLGLTRMRATGRFALIDSEVTDPYALRPRHFSGIQTWNAEAGVRQDLGKFAWGVTGFWNSGDFTFFRRNEVDRNFNGGTYLQAFAEYRPSAQTSVRLLLDNALDTTGERERTFYAPDRRNPTASAVELRERNKHVVPSLTIKHNFG